VSLSQKPLDNHGNSSYSSPLKAPSDLVIMVFQIKIVPLGFVDPTSNPGSIAVANHEIMTFPPYELDKMLSYKLKIRFFFASANILK
jgi:hypothetical protein